MKIINSNHDIRMDGIINGVLIPFLMKEVNNCGRGHYFGAISYKNKFSKPGGYEFFAEIDLMLSNRDEAMLVDLRWNYELKRVYEFLRLIKLLLNDKNGDFTGFGGKVLCAAIAGVNFDDDVRSLAAEYGMYLIEVGEEAVGSNKLIVIPPPIGTISKWYWDARIEAAIADREEKGEEKMVIEIAQNMKAAGMSVNEIVEFIDLTPNDVKQLELV